MLGNFTDKIACCWHTQNFQGLHPLMLCTEYRRDQVTQYRLPSAKLHYSVQTTPHGQHHECCSLLEPPVQFTCHGWFYGVFRVSEKQG